MEAEERAVRGGLSVKLKGRVWCPPSWEDRRPGGNCPSEVSGRGNGQADVTPEDRAGRSSWGRRRLARWGAAATRGCHRGRSSWRAPVPTSLGGEGTVLSGQPDRGII